jgi:hypothetical protein
MKPANIKISQMVSFAAISESSPVTPVLNATWEINADDTAKRPIKGDVIITPCGTEWHIQKVTTIAHRNVWQCRAYATMTGLLPHETMNILRPFAAVSETGTSTIAWRRIKTNLPVKVICNDMLAHHKPAQSKRKTTVCEKKLRAYFRDHVPLQKHDLVELPDGRQYKITRTRNSDQTRGWTELFLTIKSDPVVIR